MDELNDVRSNDEIAVTQSAHSAPPTECADYLAEMWGGALEREGVPRTIVADDRRDVCTK